MVDSINPRSPWFPLIAYLEYVIYVVGIVLSIMSFLYHIFREVGGNNKVRNESSEKDPIVAPEVTVEAINEKEEG